MGREGSLVKPLVLGLNNCLLKNWWARKEIPIVDSQSFAWVSKRNCKVILLQTVG